MATEEARSLLDALMGGDRNAPLPPGAAVPRSKKKRRGGGGRRSKGSSSQLLLPGKRSKSCYDKDICPLYCAWGIDVYELFVNTKSDIGPNPYVVDDGARDEYLKLQFQDRQMLGFEHFLFQKLQELVRTCDRTVTRNKEKLAQEMKRIMAKRGNTPYVEDVDENAVESLARAQFEMELLKDKLGSRLHELDEISEKEQQFKEKLGPLLAKQQQQETKTTTAETSTLQKQLKLEEQEPEIKQEQVQGTKQEGKQMDGESTTITSAVERKFKQENNDNHEEDGSHNLIVNEGGNQQEQEEHHIKGEEISTRKRDKDVGVDSAAIDDSEKLDAPTIQTELGKLTLLKNRIVWEISQTMLQIAPVAESVESQLRSLHYVKSDIAADKTVCEVSGNFMSARDADERIAAHYAGKQYVGWKLVRTKLDEMNKQFGRYGPPPPRAGPPGPGMGGPMGPGPMGGPPGSYRGGGGGSGSGGGRYDSRGGYDRGPPPPDRGGPPRGGRDRYELDRHRGGRHRSGRRSPSPPYWERGVGMPGGGSGGTGYHDRGRRDNGGVGGGSSGGNRRW